MNPTRVVRAVFFAFLFLFSIVESDKAPARAQSLPNYGVLPFPEGEKLIFEIKISRFPIYATLGNITFEFLGLSKDHAIRGSSIEYKPAEDDALMVLRAEAVSNGVLASLFGFDVRDRYETLVNRADFSARLSFKEEMEGKKHLAKTTLFSLPDETVRYNVVDFTKPQAPLRTKELPLKARMQSLLSAIYFLRLQPLADGDLLCFPVSEDEENHEFEIAVRGREAIELDQTRLATIKVEPRLFGPGRFFSRDGEMQMWLADDERRTPVRLVAKMGAGTMTATLTNYNSQPPLRRIAKPMPSPPKS